MFDRFCLGITVALRTGEYDRATTTGRMADRVRATVASGIVVVVEVVLVVLIVGVVVVGSSVTTSMESAY